MNKKLAGTVLAMMAASLIASGQVKACDAHAKNAKCAAKSEGKGKCCGKGSCKGKGHSKEAAPAPVKKHNKLKGE